MSNDILTPTAVTREVLRVAHEKLSFIGTVDRQYDDSFAKSGAKIGTQLKIRKPNKYTVRDGKTIDVQDTEEESTTLTVATQKGVDMNFSSVDLTMSLQDFSTRIIEPAVSVLTSTIESKMLEYVSPLVYNHSGTPGSLPTSLQIAQAKAKLNQGLAPKSMQNRFIQMESVDMAGVTDGLKTLFHDSKQVAKQYREGHVTQAFGLNWYENERVYSHTTGSDFTTVTVNDAGIASGDSTITAAGGNFKAGDIFTFSDVYMVHPETKATTSALQQFVATADGTTSLSFSPALITSGAKQNVNKLPDNSSAITFVGTASNTYPNHLVYHKEAFTFATADLEMPSGVDWARREVMDGLSIRLVRAYDINNDMFPCRLDILYGYEALRPEWACRVMGKGS